jgi:hypothetical protein
MAADTALEASLDPSSSIAAGDVLATTVGAPAPSAYETQESQARGGTPPLSGR